MYNADVHGFHWRLFSDFLSLLAPGGWLPEGVAMLISVSLEFCQDEDKAYKKLFYTFSKPMYVL